MDDRTIVRLFWERDESAVAESKKRYAEYCLYIANNVLFDRGDSEECLNDALLAAWNSIPPHRPENLRTYLGKLVREIAVDRWRKNMRQKRARPEFVQSLDEIAGIVSDGEFGDGLEEAELSREITKFLSSVGETKRNIFIRRYWHYDSIDSICKRYGFGKSRVLMTLKRTRDELARHLKKEGFIQ